MATVTQPKMQAVARKVTAKPRPNFDLKAATKSINARFSETLKYLAR